MVILLYKIAKKFGGNHLEAVRPYHKSNLSKTVGIAIVVVAFEYILENIGI